MAVSIEDLIGKQEDPEEALLRLQKEFSLADRQRDFVYHYVRTNGNRKQAALEAGYLADKRNLIEDDFNQGEAALKARNSLAVTTTNLMKHPKITQALAQFEEIYKNRKKSNIEKDVYRISQLRATYDIREFADAIVGDSPEVIAQKIRDLPEDLAVAVDNVEFKYWGKDADRFTVNFKFADRQKSIEFLSKLTGLMVDKKEITNKGMPTINIAVLGDAGSSEKKVN